MYRSKLWTMRMFAGFGTAEETNVRFKEILRGGGTGLSTAFDLVTLMGRDSDDPLALGEVGKSGVAIDTLADMTDLFADIDLGGVSTSMTINSPAAILIRALDPIEGVDVMRRRRLRRRRSGTRRDVADTDLCRRPGNLTVALRIDLRQNQADLTRGPLTIQDYGLRPDRLARSKRIGIRVGVEQDWRCCWVGKTVSGRA